MYGDAKTHSWFWWIFAIIALVAIIGGGLWWYTNGKKPVFPSGLVEQRQEVSQILDDLSRVEDVDIAPLVDLEAKKDYAGAVALMDRALAANANSEKLVASLAGASNSLAELALQIQSDDIGTKAIGAFNALVRLAEDERKFFSDRRELYELTRSYYQDLADKKNPPIPGNLGELVNRVTERLQAVKESNTKFSAAISAFDAAVGTQ